MKDPNSPISSMDLTLDQAILQLQRLRKRFGGETRLYGDYLGAGVFDIQFEPRRMLKNKLTIQSSRGKGATVIVATKER